MPILFLLLGCVGDTEPEICDTNVYICDTAAFWDRQNQQEHTWDDTAGTWLDVVRQPRCVDGLWEFIARTSGRTNGANLVNAWIVETEETVGWNEEHPLDVVESNPVTVADELLTVLQSGVAIVEIMAGQRTALACGVHDTGPLVTYAFRIYDLTGNLADCAIFSTEVDPATAIDDILSGTRPAPVPITNEEQLNPANCSTWIL
jgi:hypothetical protein